MLKRHLLIISLLLVIIASYPVRADLTYNRGNAYDYATKYCGDGNGNYNPDYISYGNPDPKNPGNHTGTDCANFVSQVLWAGGLDLNIHPPACLLAYQVISSTPGQSGWVGAQALIKKA
ncbi:MAG: amidase domain-containing protein [Deltaproteobacteria bacterium]|nr:amidase domain-containing protein [Deltaproteobacteria bacterium]